jgi:hypothetical protein
VVKPWLKVDHAEEGFDDSFKARAHIGIPGNPAFDQAIF